MRPEECRRNVVAKIFSVVGLFFMFALTSAARTKEQIPQEDRSPIVCGNEFHEVSWTVLPLNDVPGEPSIPGKKVRACFPNCPGAIGRSRAPLTLW
jgi:hypothetical protein